MKNNILFILPVSSQPRYSKRIQSYLNKNYIVTVASFEREYFKKNKLPSNIDYISLGKIESGNYFKRIPKLALAIKKILKLSKSNNLVYVFSVDILLFIFLFIEQNKLYFEIGDIRKVSNNKFITLVYDRIYKKALRKCSKIFVTSIGFKNYFINKYCLKPKQFYIIENKLPLASFPLSQRLRFKKLNNKTYTLGIIGLLRYDNIISLLKAYNKANVDFKIKIFGDGPLKEDIMNFVDDDKVKYFGQFKNPDDLFDIYMQTDISFTMYNNEDENVRLALPNKLYESIYFNTPIIVSTNTFLEKMVDKHQIGFSWNPDEMDELIDYLNTNEFVVNYNNLESNFKIIKENKFLSE